MSKTEKRNTDTEALSRLNQLPLRCGDCLHFKGSAHPAYGAPCHTLGIKPYAAAPSCYTPNVMLFRKAGANTFAVLGTLLSSFSPQQCRILMGLLKSVGSLEKHGFTFLQKVYFKVGDDFLDNYFSGRVLGVGLNGTLAVVGENYFAVIKHPIIAYLFPDSIFSSDRFKKKKKALEGQGLVYAPRKPHRNVVSTDYEPPTMETSPELLEKMATQTFGKKKVKPKTGSTLEVDLGSDRKGSVAVSIPPSVKTKPPKQDDEEDEPKKPVKMLRRSSDDDPEDDEEVSAEEDEEFED